MVLRVSGQLGSVRQIVYFENSVKYGLLFLWVTLPTDQDEIYLV